MRLGLLGGTFDPIHDAHLAMAKKACDACGLDFVWFIPNKIPPHKADGPAATWEHRYEMVALACAEDPRFRPSRLEERSRKSFTVHTLRAVREEMSDDDELFFLIGADAFAEIGSWYRREEVFELVTFVVISRPGHHYATPEGARTVRLESLSLDISSSRIRQQLAAGETSVPLPRPVLDYILVNKVYKLGLSTERTHVASGGSE